MSQLNWDFNVDSFSPTEGIEGNEYELVISGSNLDNITEIKLCKYPTQTYGYNYTTLKILSQSNTTIVVLIPSTLECGIYEVCYWSKKVTHAASYYHKFYTCYTDDSLNTSEPVHINDMNYEDLIHYDIFCKLLSEEKYEEGYQYLVDNKVNFLNANFFNTFQDRLKKTQEYIDANKERITAYEDKPTEKTKNMIWISDEEDN